MRNTNNIFLFHLRSYNDTDHITPVIDYFIKKKERVHVLYLSKFDYDKDYRIQHLQKSPLFSVSRVNIFYKIRKHILFNRYLISLVEKFKIISVIHYLLRTIWINNYLTKAKACIFEWSDSGVINLRESKLNKIPTICLPHGYTTYTNMDLNEHIEEIKYKTGNWPDHSDRNKFDSYVVQTNRHKELNLNWGLNKKTINIIGSARYCKEWSEFNLSLLKKFTVKKCSRNKLKVLFFLPHWIYKTNYLESIKVIKKIANNSNIFLVIKAHTRGTGSIFREDYISLEKSKNVIINSSFDSPSLVRWSDVVINIASSIALEALIQKRPIIYPFYLHRNKTIYDNPELVNLASGCEEVLSLIINHYKGKKLFLPKKEFLRQFLINEVYGGDESSNVLKTYYDHILNCESY